MEAEPKLRVARKRRLRGWCLFFGVVILVFLGFLAVRWYEEYRAEERIRGACAVADADDPNWRLSEMMRKYQSQPTATTFVEMYEAFPTATTGEWYRGWYGDDILTRPGAISYQEDLKPNIRLPEPYLKTLRERLQDPRLANLRKRINAFGREPHGYLPEVDGITDRWIQETRYLLNYCADEVLLAANEGRLNDVLPWINHELALGEKMKQYPSCVHNLVALAQLSITVRDAQRMVMFGTASPDQLSTLQSSLCHCDHFDQARIIRLLRAEQTHYLELARRDPIEKEKLRRHLAWPAPRTNASFLDSIYSEWEKIRFEMAISSLQIAEAETLELANEDVSVVKESPSKLMPLNFPSYKRAGSEKHHLVTQMDYDGVVTKLLAAHARAIAHVRSTIAAIACETLSHR
jgi:hypothetical protein